MAGERGCRISHASLPASFSWRPLPIYAPNIGNGTGGGSTLPGKTTLNARYEMPGGKCTDDAAARNVECFGSACPFELGHGEECVPDGHFHAARRLPSERSDLIRVKVRALYRRLHVRDRRAYAAA